MANKVTETEKIFEEYCRTIGTSVVKIEESQDRTPDFKSLEFDDLIFEIKEKTTNIVPENELETNEDDILSQKESVKKSNNVYGYIKTIGNIISKKHGQFNQEKINILVVYLKEYHITMVDVALLSAFGGVTEMTKSSMRMNQKCNLFQKSKNRNISAIVFVFNKKEYIAIKNKYSYRQVSDEILNRFKFKKFEELYPGGLKNWGF